MFFIVMFLLILLKDSQPKDTDDNEPVPVLPEITLPQKCMLPSTFQLKQCCMFPPFFFGKVTRSCGAVMSLIQSYTDNKVLVMKTQTPRDNCQYWKCVLKKYDILDLERKVDEEKWQMHLKRWIQKNPLFKKVMKSAKNVCVQRYAVLFPLEPCDFYRYLDCYRSHINIKCPVTINTPECKRVKDFYEECGKYYETLA